MSSKSKVFTLLFRSYLDLYRRKGFYIFLNTCYSFFIFMILPIVGKSFWPEKISNEGKFMFWCFFWTHQISFILSNAFYIILYYFDLMKESKIDKNPWPWQSDYPKWLEQLKKTIVTITINHFILAPVMALPAYFMGSSPFRLEYETLPSAVEIIWQNLYCVLVDDFFFYWSHRILHWNKIYPYIHKQHHEYISTVGIAVEYAHPIEYVFGNIIPSSIGIFVLGRRMHGYTALFNVFRKIVSATEGHSGFELKFSFFKFFPFFAPGDYHAYHHLNFRGNYGNSYIMDILCDTLNDTYLKKMLKDMKNNSDNENKDFTDKKNRLKNQ
jgi:methylsterol monooxygenase